MATHKLSQQMTTSSGSVINEGPTHTEEGETYRDLKNANAVPGSSVDYQVAFTLDVSECKSFIIQTNVDVTVKTNNGGAPDNTLSLKAGTGYVWDVNFVDAFQLTVDVTDLFITVPGTEPAEMSIKALYDSSP